MFELFDKMVSQVILYNGEIWGAFQLKKKTKSEQNFAENVFSQTVSAAWNLDMKFIKIALGVKSKAITLVVKPELGG